MWSRDRYTWRPCLPSPRACDRCLVCCLINKLNSEASERRKVVRILTRPSGKWLKMSFEDGGDLASFAAIAESTIVNKEGENVEATAESASSKNEETMDVKEEETANNESSEGDPAGEQSEPPPAEAANSSEETTETDSSAAQLTSEQQRTYANLQPIFLAMEMGQDAVNQAQEQNQENAAVEIGQQQAAYIATTSEQFTQPGQGTGMLLSTVATSGSETPASLASILQDVVSGMQSGTGTVPAAIITDPNSGSGSFLIVNQNGVPIVRPVLVSNLPAGGVGQGGAVSVSAETLQVLTAGLHAVDDGSVGSGQETVTVDVSEETEGSSGGGDLSVEATVDIGTDTVAVVAGAQAAVAQPVGDNAAELEEGEVEATAAIQKPITVRNPTGKRKLSDGPRVCEQCNKSFKYPSDLKKHLQIHTDIKKFKCEDCGRFFRRLHQLNVHQRIHSGEKPYVCPRCGMAFRHDSTVTMHIRTRHDHLRPFKCDECGSLFGRLSHLKKHIRKVCGDNKNKEKPIAQCRFCDVTFPTKGDLRKHLLICEKKEAKVKAKEVTLHICETCNKEFASPYNLRRHQLTHTDEKPYQCDVCNRQFKEKSSLTKHIKRKHTGVDQGSQTDETGEQEDGYVNVDVIAESAAASGVTMETEETVEAGIAAESVESTVDASSLISGEDAQGSGQQVTEVVQASGEVEMATVELSLANAAAGSAHSHDSALQAAVEALVSASQHQIGVTQEAMEEDSSSGKEIFEGVTSQDAEGAAALMAVYVPEVKQAEVNLELVNVDGSKVEFVEATEEGDEEMVEEEEVDEEES